MAVSTQLARVVADLCGEPEPSVANAYRYLRESELVSKKGRGVTGAHMTEDDCVTLLCAVMGSRQINESAVAAKAILALRSNPYPGYQGRKEGLPPGYALGLHVEHTLSEALVRLIDLFGRLYGQERRAEMTDLAERLRVDFKVRYPEYSATIEFRISQIHHTISYGRRSPGRLADQSRARSKSVRTEGTEGEIDIGKIGYCTDRTFRRLAKLLAN